MDGQGCFLLFIYMMNLKSRETVIYLRFHAGKYRPGARAQVTASWPLLFSLQPPAFHTIEVISLLVLCIVESFPSHIGIV